MTQCIFDIIVAGAAALVFGSIVAFKAAYMAQTKTARYCLFVLSLSIVSVVFMGGQWLQSESCQQTRDPKSSD